MAHSTPSPWPSLHPNIDERPGWQRRDRIQTQVRFSSWAARYNTASEIPAHPSRSTEISLKATSWPELSWFWHRNNYLLIMEGTLDQKSGNLCPLKFLNPSHHFLFLWSWRGYNNYLSYLSHEDEVIEETDQNPSNMMKVVTSNDIIYLSSTMALFGDDLLVIQNVFPLWYINKSFLISLISFLPNQPTWGPSRSHHFLLRSIYIF